ncbi:MAG: hypothetical protein ABW042_00490 [Phenylobacterium sp.]
MSDVRYHTPENRLGKLLRMPGGVSVADAIEQAHAGVATLEEPALDQLMQVLAAAEAAVERLPPAFDGAVIAELYGVAQGAVGLASLAARPSADAALRSLCELLDHLTVGQTWDPEAVLVHVRAFRLLIGAEGMREGAGADAVLEGLKRVTERYAAPEAP